ncbi:MAG: dicarboxylate/amino acid:cation symporter [Gemmatimonadota bacterium]|nr:dicarboxylate/amino acid:cation symporter [Gemmatimonadota bacterium]HEU4990819.1 dicarboxylate/amino acid:cation symporter [Gemmatimonadaceae bacterium]
MKRLPVQMVIAVVLGTVAGLLVAAAHAPWADRTVSIVAPLGTIWVNAILMTVVPLVVVNVIVASAASAERRNAVRGATGTFVMFVGVVTASAVVCALLSPGLLSLLVSRGGIPLPPSSAAAAAEQPSIAALVVSIVPGNPVKAAADGAMLGLIVFSLLFGFATTRIDAQQRASIVALCRAVSDALLVIVDWVLRVGPIGVFALILPVAQRIGFDVLRSLAGYMLVVTLLCAVVTIGAYVLAVLGGGVAPGRFARALAPPQAIAFGSRSSLATLPSLMRAAEDDLALPADVSGLVLPLATAMLKVAAPIASVTGAIFIARVYGIHLGAARMLPVIAISVFTSFGVPGVPNGAWTQLPVFLAAGIPAQGIGILLAVDAIPDALRTVTNVSVDLAVATVIARWTRAA